MTNYIKLKTLLIIIITFQSNLSFAIDCEPSKLMDYFNKHIYGYEKDHKYYEDKIICAINNGADVNSTSDEAGQTALYSASAQGLINVVKLLLDKNADVNKPDWFGETPIWAASFKGDFDFEIVKLLIEHGANVNASDDNGNTALMNASGSGAVDVVKLLIEHGADVNTRTSKTCHNELCKGDYRGLQRDRTALDNAKQQLERFSKNTKTNNDIINDYKEIIIILENTKTAKVSK